MSLKFLLCTIALLVVLNLIIIALFGYAAFKLDKEYEKKIKEIKNDKQ